jgi:outer membrane protein
MSKIKTTTLVILSICMVGNFNASAQTDSLWSIQQCINYALKNNLTVQDQQLALQSNQINLKQSKMEIAPSLNASSNFGLNWGLSINPITNIATLKQQSNGFGSLNASWLIYNGGRVLNTIRQNKALLESGENQLEKTKNDVILLIITYYTNVIFNKELLNNAESQYKSTNSQLERTQKQVKAGALPRSSELDLQAQLASNEQNVINADNVLQLSILQLKQAMLLHGSDPLDVIIPEIELDSSMLVGINPELIYEDVKNSRPEIKTADGQVEASEIGIAVAKGSYYPRLSLNAGFNTNYSSIVADRGRFEADGTFEEVPIGFVQGTNQIVVTPVENRNVINYPTSDQLSDNVGKSVSLSLSIPIFNNLRTNAAVQNAKIRRERAVVQAEQARQLLRQTIETASTDALSSAKSYVSSFKQVEAREESFRATKQRYENGAANYTEYQIAENNLFQAKSDLLRAKYSFIFRLKILDFYQGKPIEL